MEENSMNKSRAIKPTLGPNISGSSMWNWLHLTILTPRILRRLLDFWKLTPPCNNEIWTLKDHILNYE